MIYEKKKLAKIVEELTLFFFTIGGNNISSTIEDLDDVATITFTSNYSPQCAHRLEALTEFLNRERDGGIEDVYWELAGCGDTDHSSQLLLIGVMVDSASLDITENRVSITLKKYN